MLKPEASIAESNRAIDREARDKLADLFDRRLRGELDGSQLSRGAFELMGSEDHAIDAIGVELSTIFSEMGPTTMRRCLAYLKSNHEYEWPNEIYETPKDFTFVCLVIIACATIGSLFALSSERLRLIAILCGVVVAAIVVWLSRFVIYRRQIRTQSKRHRDAGRDIEAWPFLRLRDVPSDCVGPLIPNDDPAAVRSV